MLERFSLPPVLPGFVPRYNICPSQQQWTIARDSSGKAIARQMRWGLIPSWANDPSVGQRMVNARAESLTEKPSYSTPLKKQRCLVLADGYYEWKAVGKRKVPFYFRLVDGRAFGMAGLWDRWDKGDAPLETCTVITTAAAELLSLLAPYEAEDLEMYEVSRYVNNPSDDSEECIQRVDNLWRAGQTS